MAALLKNIKRWFSSKSADTTNEVNVDELNIENPISETSTINLNATSVVQFPDQSINSLNQNLVLNPELKIPNWLEDEETLRDEGVLFGLSQSEPTEKTDIIHKYFSHLSAIPLRKIEECNEQIQDLNLFIGQKVNRIDWIDAHLNASINKPSQSEHQIPRIMIGLILSVAMCVGNFFLIESTLIDAYTNPTPIALGVFLAGMFSLFRKISLFHETDPRLSWQSLLEEIGIPLAASLFIFSKVLPVQGIFEAACLFLFIFFLFLFAGKILLSNITVLRKELLVWSQARANKLDTIRQIDAWNNEKSALEHEVANLRIKRWPFLKEQNQSESERDQLFARRDMLIKIFESEFYLARRMKNQLSKKQLDLIQDRETSFEV